MIINNIILYSTVFLLWSSIVHGQQNNGIIKPSIDQGPFLLHDEQKTNNNLLLRFSVLSGYREDLAPEMNHNNLNNYTNKENGTTMLGMYNQSLLDMLSHGLYKPNRAVLKVKEPWRYAYDSSQGSEQTWIRKNGHCFELLLPTELISKKVFDKTLYETLGVSVSVEKRLTDVLILYNINNNKTRKSNNDVNVFIEKLVSKLNDILPPVINEAQYVDKDNINLQLHPGMSLLEIKTALKPYGLDLKTSKRELEMLVIIEKQNTNEI